MANTDALFHQLDDIFVNILAGMSSGDRKRTMREISIVLRRSQQQRIARQQNPDGSKYEVRRRKILRAQVGIKFIWVNDEAQDEVRSLKNWRYIRTARGKMITGFDEDRKAVRSFYRRDIEHFLEINTKRLKKEQQRKVPMFRDLRTSKWLRAKSNPNEATVGFYGTAARIARAHQLGLKEKIGVNQYVTNARRELLGLNKYDRRLIIEKMIESMRLQ